MSGGLVGPAASSSFHLLPSLPCQTAHSPELVRGVVPPPLPWLPRGVSRPLPLAGAAVAGGAARRERGVSPPLPPAAAAAACRVAAGRYARRLPSSSEEGQGLPAACWVGRARASCARSASSSASTCARFCCSATNARCAAAGQGSGVDSRTDSEFLLADASQRHARQPPLLRP